MSMSMHVATLVRCQNVRVAAAISGSVTVSTCGSTRRQSTGNVSLPQPGSRQPSASVFSSRPAPAGHSGRPARRLGSSSFPAAPRHTLRGRRHRSHTAHSTHTGHTQQVAHCTRRTVRDTLHTTHNTGHTLHTTHSTLQTAQSRTPKAENTATADSRSATVGYLQHDTAL